MITKEEVEEILDSIPDPEIGISVWQLGLIYDIVINEPEKLVTITMTLTSIGCPLFDHIAGPIREKLMAANEEIKDVKIDLTFDPPWSIEKVSEEAKMQLGLA